MRECTRCGTRTPDDIVRCPRCGYSTRDIVDASTLSQSEDISFQPPLPKQRKQKRTLLGGLLLLLGLRKDPKTGAFGFAPAYAAVTVATVAVTATAAILGPAVVKVVTIQSTVTYHEQIAIAGQSPTDVPGQYPVRIHARLGSACQDTDNDQPQTQSVPQDTNNSVGVTLKFTASCSGSYFHGHLDYTETFANIEEDVSSGSSGIACTTTASVTFHMSGDAGNGNSINGQYSRDKIDWTCNPAVIQLVDPIFNGNWTGQIS